MNVMRLTTDEFIRRFLIHSPSGFIAIRHAASCERHSPRWIAKISGLAELK